MNEYYYLEVKLPHEIEAHIDALVYEKFHCTGIEEFSIEESKVDEILGERSYSGGDVPKSVIDEVESTLRSEGIFKKYYFSKKVDGENLKLCLFDEFKVDSKLCVEGVKDWNLEWKKHYQPIWVGSELEIIPEWEKGIYTSKAREIIYIYPGMGFGTGSHETTFLCLKFLLKVLKKRLAPSTCLDFGCGSGILGMAYSLFEKKAVVDLYDISEEAIENSIQNIELNNLNKDSFNLLLPNKRESINKKYSLIFANILQNVLLDESDFLGKSLDHNGHMILSGLLKGQEDEVIEKILTLNPKLSHIETLVKGDWVAVLIGNI